MNGSKSDAGPDGEYGAYFYIKDGKNGQPPTNWRSYFGGSVWEKVPGYDNVLSAFVCEGKTA